MTVTSPRMNQIAREIGELNWPCTSLLIIIWRHCSSFAISPVILIGRQLCTLSLRCWRFFVCSRVVGVTSQSSRFAALFALSRPRPSLNRKMAFLAN